MSEKAIVKLHKQFFASKCICFPCSISGLCITKASRIVIAMIIRILFTFLSLSSKKINAEAERNSRRPKIAISALGKALKMKANLNSNMPLLCKYDSRFWIFIANFSASMWLSMSF